jgi:pimeloyl-ACP methyl ester carboxylesterase
MRFTFFIVFLFLFGYSCQKEKITFGTNVSDVFYLDNANASMRIMVEGNTLSKVFAVLIHGGPGESSYFYNTDYINTNLESKYSIVYWDQRNAGASQGNRNGNDLNLKQITEDLKKVIQLLKGRYGQNSSVFILAHSFGGMVASSFMTTADYQSMVKGWIVVDGSHNYPLNDTLTRQMLITSAQQQITLNKHVVEWENILSYCNLHKGNFTLEESQQLESFAEDAETYIEGVKEFDVAQLIKSNLTRNDWPLTSLLVNYLYSSNSDLIKELYKTEFSSTVHKIAAPTLLLYGQYDFICPKELGMDLFNRISSTDKKMVISPISGHNLMSQDEELFVREVDQFLELHK